MRNQFRRLLNNVGFDNIVDLEDLSSIVEESMFEVEGLGVENYIGLVDCIVLLENLRFHKEETKNDSAFAKEIASLGDVFVNDAFGTAHRAHASTEGVTHYLESVSGFLVQKEIEYFDRVLGNPQKPFIFILGGAKVSDKIPVIENMLSKADAIVIGGAMAYTFMKVKGIDTGSSRLQEEWRHLSRPSHVCFR